MIKDQFFHKHLNSLMQHIVTKKNYVYYAELIAILSMGLSTKYYKGPYFQWVNNSSGGIFYEIFWIIVLFRFVKITPIWSAIVVFLVTSLIEMLQLVHTPVLNKIRSNFIGQILLGNSFNKSDFIYYLIGCFIGWRLVVFTRVDAKNDHLTRVI